MPDVVEVVQVLGAVVEVEAAITAVVEVAAAVGPRGPAGSGAVSVEIPVPEGTWSIPHDLGRLPAVQLVVDGYPVDAPMTVSLTHVVVTWPYPVAGTAILI